MSSLNIALMFVPDYAAKSTVKLVKGISTEAAPRGGGGEKPPNEIYSF